MAVPAPWSESELQRLKRAAGVSAGGALLVLSTFIHSGILRLFLPGMGLDSWGVAWKGTGGFYGFSLEHSILYCDAFLVVPNCSDGPTIVAVPGFRRIYKPGKHSDYCFSNRDLCGF